MFMQIQISLITLRRRRRDNYIYSLIDKIVDLVKFVYSSVGMNSQISVTIKVRRIKPIDNNQ